MYLRIGSPILGNPGLGERIVEVMTGVEDVSTLQSLCMCYTFYANPMARVTSILRMLSWLKPPGSEPPVFNVTHAKTRIQRHLSS